MASQKSGQLQSLCDKKSMWGELAAHENTAVRILGSQELQQWRDAKELLSKWKKCLLADEGTRISKVNYKDCKLPFVCFV